MGVADHNANNVKTPGVYRIPETGDDIQNYGVNQGFLLVFSADNGNMVFHIAINYDASVVKIRNFWWSKWYEWNEISVI